MWKTLLVTAALLLGGCARGADHASTAAPNTPLVPTPSVAPVEALGPLTTPLPTGVTAITVTFAQPGTGAKVIYRKTVTDPATMQQIISEVDGLHVAGNETQGCAMFPTGLQLDFTTPTSVAAFSEDSECARATLTIAGKTGPPLASVLLFDI